MPVNITQVFLTLATVAFSAWAGVVLWVGNNAINQLEAIRSEVKQVHYELEDFRNAQIERVSILETKVNALEIILLNNKNN